MTILGKDSLVDTAGVLITAHTPSGTGATGGSWVAGVASGYSAPVAQSGGGFDGAGVISSAGVSYMNASQSAAPNYSQVDITLADTTHQYAGVMLAQSAMGGSGQNYQFQYQPGVGLALLKDGGLTVITSTAYTPATGTPLLFQITRSVSGATATLSGYINGVLMLTGSDSTSAYTGSMYGGICTYSTATPANQVYTNFETGTSSSTTFTCNYSTVYTSSTAQVELIMTGVGTSWTGSTTFSTSLGTIASQTNISATKQIIKFVPGTSTGTATFSNNTDSATTGVTIATGSIVQPNSSLIQLKGLVNISAQDAITVTSGPGGVAFFSGDSCNLRFNVGTLSVYPDIMYQVDRDPVQRVSLSPSAPSVTVTPVFTSSAAPKALQHSLKWWYAVFEGTGSPQPTINKWTSLLTCADLAGIDLPGSGALATLPPLLPNVLWTIGDSITESVRTLYTGSTSDQTVERPYSDWSQLLADRLGFELLQTGYGGTGVSTGGSGGVPSAPNSIGHCYNGVTYTPPITPLVAIIFHGTNDGGASSATFQADYVLTLQAARAFAPGCLLFCINPYTLTGGSSRVSDITAAIATSGYSNAFVYDATTAGIVSNDTADGTHLNPGGHDKLFNWMAGIVQTKLTALGVRMQTSSSSGPRSYTFAA